MPSVDKSAERKLKELEVREGRLSSYLRRVSARKAFRGPWLYIGFATWGFRLLRRMARRKPEILLLEELKPGQRIIVSNSRPTIDVG